MVAGRARSGKRRRWAATWQDGETPERPALWLHGVLNDPRLTRIYTKTGDEGMTGLGGGQRAPKDSRRVETSGTVDELNSQIGVALAGGLSERLAAELERIQNEQVDLGSPLATPAPSQDRHAVPTVQPPHSDL